MQPYMDYLNRLPLSKHTRRAYLTRVKQFLVWLDSTVDGDKALSSSADRDFAIRDYRVHLLQSGSKAASVNAALVAIDNYCFFLGIGAAKVKRQDLPEAAPKALDAEELRRVLRAISRCDSARNRTIALLMLHTGLRISELVALNVGDVFVTARKGEILVRCGKGNKQRRIPLNRDAREVLQIYLSGPGEPTMPLFKSVRGNRISVNAVDHFIRQLAREAGVEMSCHRIRHTCLSRLVRAGIDIVIVAEVAGHSRLETTRRYSLPSANDKILAMEKLNYDPS